MRSPATPPPGDISFRELVDHWPRYAPAAVAASTWPRLLTQSGVLLIESAGPFTAELEKRAPAILAALPLVDGHRVQRLSFRYVAPVNGEPVRFNVRRPRRSPNKPGKR